MKIKVLCILLSIFLLGNKLAMSGIGATHPFTGALFAKYLSYNKQLTTYDKFLSYGSAFFVGTASHLISDHYGNYEPRSGTWEMLYFSAEGVIGIFLLIPQWNKDTRLFWGSVGGMVPDLEHTIRLFGERKFPCHNGKVPHGERMNFWQGAVENLLLNGLSYYLITKDVSHDNNQLPIYFGTRLSFWDGGSTNSSTFSNSIYDVSSSVSYELVLQVPLKKSYYLELNASTFLSNLENPTNDEIAPKLVVQGFFGEVVRYLDLRTGTFSPFVGVGGGVYLSGVSNSVNKGGISFFHYTKSKFRFVLSLGLDIQLFKGTSLELSLHHQKESQFAHLQNSQLPGWQQSLTILHEI